MPTRQCMKALDQANDVRLARAQVKRELKDFKINPIDILTGADLGDKIGVLVARAKLEKVPVYEYLMWIPYVGKSKANKIIQNNNLSDTLKLGNLSDVTRALLVTRLRESLGRYRSYKPRVGIVASPSPVAV